MDAEYMESVHGSEYLFYSFGKLKFIFILNYNKGEPFDHTVRMEFL